MSLIKKLTDTPNGSPLSKNNGGSVAIPDFQTSTLHNEYSTIDDPAANAVRPRNGKLPTPSNLNGPSDPSQYIQNLPN
tara:strand:+ start:1579 stop:1812 length:234 start_codon:yes stop_codon:yes gene_type:complete